MSAGTGADGISYQLAPPPREIDGQVKVYVLCAGVKRGNLFRTKIVPVFLWQLDELRHRPISNDVDHGGWQRLRVTSCRHRRCDPCRTAGDLPQGKPRLRASCRDHAREFPRSVRTDVPHTRESTPPRVQVEPDALQRSFSWRFLGWTRGKVAYRRRGSPHRLSVSPHLLTSGHRRSASR